MKAERLLKELGYADQAAFQEVEERVKKEVEAGVDFAEQSPLPEGREALEGVFATNGEEPFHP
jgi:pyruvate dehydrogenase E1 component alpha subunit